MPNMAFDFFPWTQSTFQTQEPSMSVDELISKIEIKKDIFGRDDLKLEWVDQNECLVRLNRRNLYYIEPLVKVAKCDGKVEVRSFIGDMDASIIAIWLFFSLTMGVLLLGGTLYFHASGQTTVPFEMNGEYVADINMFPWVYLFILVFMSFFFACPAFAISRGMKAAERLARKIAKSDEV